MLSRRTRILLAVLVVASLTFIILDLRGGQGPLTGVRNVGANALGGLERVEPGGPQGAEPRGRGRREEEPGHRPVSAARRRRARRWRAFPTACCCS